MNKLQLAIHGAAGRMGQRLIALASADESLQLVAAIDSAQNPRLGTDAGLLAGVGEIGIPLSSELSVPAGAVIDFSVPAATTGILQACAAAGVPLVLATTGLSPEQHALVREAAARIPIVWSPSMSLAVNLTMKLCEIAGIAPGDWMEGAPLPKDAHTAEDRESVFTEWDSEHNGISISLRTLFRDNWIVTAYGKSSLYEGTEGELYDLQNDPMQWRNLWNEPAAVALKKDLLAELRDKSPKQKEPHRPVVASV